MMKEIKLGELRHFYEDAVRNNYGVIDIHGLKFVTPYLKYVIQYAEMNKLGDDDKINFADTGKMKPAKPKAEEINIGGASNGSEGKEE